MEGVAFFMLKPTAGQRAMREAMRLSGLCSLFAFWVAFCNQLWPVQPQNPRLVLCSAHS